jgi:hypothetical protein
LVYVANHLDPYTVSIKSKERHWTDSLYIRRFPTWINFTKMVSSTLPREPTFLPKSHTLSSLQQVKANRMV